MTRLALLPALALPLAAMSEKPNVIFIMADDLGYGDVGCFGGETIATPRLDQMAADGLRFTDAYSGAPVCAPARDVLMTGRHTGHNTVRANRSALARSKDNPQGRVPLADETITLAEVLKEAGYATAITGKWGLGEPGTPGIPTQQGFDEWLGFLNQNRAHSYYPPFIWRNEEKLELPGNADGKQQDYVHDRFTDFAVDFVSNPREQPFFLYLAYTIPHDKFQIPSLGAYADKPWSEDEKTYAAMVSRLDRDVGRLLDALDEAGIDDDTLVFFCSDNGPAKDWKPFTSKGPFRGIKRSLHEGGIRTPMIARWPGTIEPGRTSDLPWSFQDLMPTLATLAGTDAPADLDGVDISPALRGEPLDLSERFLYWEMHEGGPFRQAARQGHWKAMREGIDGALSLYDLEADPGETTDRAADHPELVTRFTDYLDQARTPSPHWPVEGE